MKTVLLGAGASVAVYKACDLASKLVQAGFAVRTVLTPRAAQLVSPQLFEAVSAGPARVDEYEGRRGAMDHIDLSQGVDLFVVAPAAADLIARLALGLGNDLLTTTSLALAPGVPRLLAPAMNPNMLAQPALQRHLETLRGDGWTLVEPGEGHTACGVQGKGRMAEPAELLSRIKECLA